MEKWAKQGTDGGRMTSDDFTDIFATESTERHRG